MRLGKRVLAALMFWRKPPPRRPSGRDRRKWPRINLDVEARLTFDRVGPEMRARIVNASAKGLYLAMSRPRPLGTRMRITMVVGQDAQELRVEGVVVHVVPEATASEVAGVGLVLTETGADWLKLCEQLAATEAADDPDSSQG